MEKMVIIYMSLEVNNYIFKSMHERVKKNLNEKKIRQPIINENKINE